ASVLASVVVADSAATAHGTSSSGDTAPEVVIGTDGTFRLASAFGRAEVQLATLLGAAARERHRVIRLAQIDDALSQLEARLADLDREHEALTRRRAAIDAEVADQPP